MLEELMEETGWADYWRREGHRRGVQEGMQEGVLEGERRMLMIMLEGRFGALGDDFTTALASTGEDTLRALAENVSHDTLEQVRRRLGLD